uniref:myb-like protein X isoform X5 n=1 Tax=Styela clava TaxID=7725 RepID=UPI00193966AE|nr:myb-like protein X isoform X5 [Styela clava]
MSVIDPIPFQELDSHLPQSNKSFIEKATQTSDLEAEKFSSKFTKKQKKKVEVSKGNTESDQKVQKKVRAALLTTSSKSSTKFESKKDNVKTTKSTKKDQEPRKKSDGKMRAINSIPRKTLKTNLPASHKSLTNKESQMNDMGAAKSKQVKGKKDKVPKGNIKSVLKNFLKKRKGEAPKEIITNSKNKKGKGKDGLMNSKPVPVPSEPNLATSNTNEDEIGSHMGDVEKSSSCTKIIKVREIQTDKQKSRLMDKISTKAHASRLSTSTKKESQMDGLKTVKSTKKVKNRTEFTKSQKSNEKMDSRKEEKKLVYHKPDKGKSNSGIPVGPYKEKINNRHQMPRPNYGNRRKVKTSTKHEDEDEEEIREEIEIDCSTNDVILRLRNFPFAPIRRNSMKNKQGAMAEKEGMHSNEEWYFRRGKNKWAHHEPEKQKPSPGMPVIKRYKDKFNNRMQITEQDYGSRDEAMMPKEDEENEEDEEIMEEIEIDCSANEESPPLWDFSLTALEKTNPKTQKATFEPYVTKLPRLNRKLDFYKRNWTNGHYGISSNLETRLGMPVKRQKGKPFVNRMEFLPRQIPYFGNKRKADKLKEQSEDGGYKYKPPWNFSTDVNAD